MKQETILKGYDHLRKIEAAQKAKEVFEKIVNVELKAKQGGRLIDLYPESEVPTNFAVFTDINFIPQELRDKIKEETIRFLQRCKRHCDDLEFKLKQELEDLK